MNDADSEKFLEDAQIKQDAYAASRALAQSVVDLEGALEDTFANPQTAKSMISGFAAVHGPEVLNAHVNGSISDFGSLRPGAGEHLGRLGEAVKAYTDAHRDAGQLQNAMSETSQDEDLEHN